MKPIRILIADDHPLFRMALESVATRLDRPVEISQASSLEETVRKLTRDGPYDLLLLDMLLSDGDTIDQITPLRKNFPDTQILVISNYQDAERIQRALRYGVRGYIPKKARTEVIEEGIRNVLEGGIYLPDDIVEMVSDARRHNGAMNGNGYHNLTRRQFEVLREIGKGSTNAEVAKTLGISEATAKLHVRQLLRRLGVKNRTEAVVRSAQMGLIEMSDVIG